MAITATNNGTQRELLPAGSYIGRCYSMVHIGTVKETILGVDKLLNKVRIAWELPTELKVFKEENGEQPIVMSREFTLSLNEKATLRKYLAAWRGKDFTEDEAKSFDITKLIGVPATIIITHKQSKSGNAYAEISSLGMLTKGVTCPPAINKPVILSYDNFDYDVYNTLPDFIKDKIRTSLEYAALTIPNLAETHDTHGESYSNDLPF